MQSQASTVEQYLAELPEDRREALQAIRRTILKNLPEGYEEGMQYGMIGYFVPHSIYPAGYHCDPNQPLPFACLASQKNYISIYLGCVYMIPGLETWFREAWAKTGKKLDMGKSCVRVKSLDDCPVKVIGQTIRRVPLKKFIACYESTIQGRAGKAESTKPGTAKKAALREKAVAKKSARR